MCFRLFPALVSGGFYENFINFKIFSHAIGVHADIAGRL